MALSKDSWLPQALKLDLQDGRSRRVNHDCGDGRTLSLSRTGSWLNARCWRCNDSGSHKLEESTSDRIARLSRAKQGDEQLTQGHEVPVGLTDPREWPPGARLWFARAGLGSHDIGALSARFDPSTGRVVLPCGGGFWQARSIDGRQPKYLAPDVAKVYPVWGDAHRITLTEDILSAYKVGKVSEGWCMLGTALPSELLTRILRSGKGVNVWLDNDLPPVHLLNRGQIAAVKIMKQLRAMGVDVRNIVTKVDPKLVPLDEIRRLTS